MLFRSCFSPDGTKIAYVKYSSDAKSTSIWIMNIDGSEQVQVTDAKKGFALNPRWSPDGTKLIFQSSKKDKKMPTSMSLMPTATTLPSLPSTSRTMANPIGQRMATSISCQTVETILATTRFGDSNMAYKL